MLRLHPSHESKLFETRREREIRNGARENEAERETGKRERVWVEKGRGSTERVGGGEGEKGRTRTYVFAYNKREVVSR